jgi:regulator of protease activity HflC (stomatin/prohibitin superfamily)
MEAALGWLGDIVQAILMLFPRLLIVRTTHEAVKWVRGSKVVLMKHDNGMIRIFPLLVGRVRRTGLHFYWPLVTEHEIVPIKRQTTNLDPQYLETRDGQMVGVSGVFIYEVVDTVALLTECYDYEDTIKDLALASIKKIIVDNDYAVIRQKPHEIDKKLTLQLRNDLKRFGIKTVRFTLSDCTRMFMLGAWGLGG